MLRIAVTVFVLISLFTHSSVDKLKNLGKDDLAEEWSGQYQGDIIISDAEIQELESPKGSKTGLIDTRFRWPNNIVPYWINESHFSKHFINAPCGIPLTDFARQLKTRLTTFTWVPEESNKCHALSLLPTTRASTLTSLTFVAPEADVPAQSVDEAANSS